MGLLFARKGKGVGIEELDRLFEKTINNVGPKYMKLSKNKYLYYSNSTMVSEDVIDTRYGGQFLATNFKTAMLLPTFVLNKICN